MKMKKAILRLSDFSHHFTVINAHLKRTKNEIPFGMSPRDLIEVEISGVEVVRE
jgi:hypothetical protein